MMCETCSTRCRELVESVSDACLNKAMNNAIGVMQDHVQSLMNSCVGSVQMMRDDIRTFLHQEAAKAHKARCNLVVGATSLTAGLEKMSSSAKQLDTCQEQLSRELKRWATLRKDTAPPVQQRAIPPRQAIALEKCGAFVHPFYAFVNLL